MWFSGSVAEAVNKSKREKKLFMVFIEGKDDVSKKMADLFVKLRDDILSLLKREVVAFKVEEGTENCKLFGQIYPILMVPSVYFISNTGVNLEVILGNASEQEFMESLDKVLLVHKTNITQVVPQSTPVSTPSTPVQPAAEPVSPVPVTATSSTEDKSKNVSGDSSQPKLDEKVAKAQQLIEQNKLKKAKEDEEKARQQELERIKSGKEMSKARARRDEIEMAELIKEREREKRETAEIRKRILADIEYDKEERRRRSGQYITKSDPKPGTSGTTLTTTIKSDANEARIQFRFADGSFKNQVFGADDQFSSLRQFVMDTSPFRDFTLSTTYPKRIFTSEDLTKSLRDLELVPNAVLLVLASPSQTSLIKTSLFQRIWPLIITPIFWIWSFFASMFNPNAIPYRYPGDSDSSTSSLPPPTPQEQRVLAEERAKRQRESKLLNRDGNITRLRDNREDKDNTDATDNGNSTQQM